MTTFFAPVNRSNADTGQACIQSILDGYQATSEITKLKVATKAFPTPDEPLERHFAAIDDLGKELGLTKQTGQFPTSLLLRNANLPIVLALAGDSTITSAFPML